MLDPDRLLALGTQPIPGDTPAGASARYDDVFTRLETEMVKLENPSGGEVDWKQAKADATTILESKSKDLLVGAYLARILLQLDGLEGLGVGLGVLVGMTTTFWDGVQPTRPRARRGAYEWISERAAGLLTPETLRPQDLAHLPAALAHLQTLWSFLADKFEGEDPGLATLKRVLTELQAGTSAGTGTDESASGGSAEAATAPAAGGAGGGGAAMGPAATRAAAIQRLREAAAYFQRHEPHSPVGFLVGRALQWSDRSFEQIFAELLKGKKDAQDQIWDQLGIPIPDGHG